MELEKQTAIVTGSARRLGAAIVTRLCELGANVVVHYHRSDEKAVKLIDAADSLSGDAIGVCVDLADPANAVNSIFGTCLSVYGPPTVLINNASVFSPGNLAEIDSDHWDRHMTVNLKSPFFLAQAFQKHLPPESPGHIINIADWRGSHPIPGHDAYTISKAGLIAMTKLLARELAPSIQVNAIAPGATLVPDNEPAAYDSRVNSIPLQRTGSAAGIADAVEYLLKSDFITGEVLHIDGGESLPRG